MEITSPAGYAGIGAGTVGVETDLYKYTLSINRFETVPDNTNCDKCALVVRPVKLDNGISRLIH